MKCKHCGSEILDKPKTIQIKKLGIEVEIEIHGKNKTLSEIQIPKGWRLLTSQEVTWLHNSKYKTKLNMEETWEFIEQPFVLNKKNKYVAWFYAYSDGAYLGYNRNPDYRGDSLGVRFCRSVKK